MKVLTIEKEAVTKTISKEKKCKKIKCFFEEALQIAKERRKVKGKGERERGTQLKARVPENSNGREEDFLK